MTADLTTTLDGYVREALQLRLLADPPPATAGPSDLLAALIDIRSRMDRAEEMLARAIRAKAAAHRASTAAAAQVDDAWDEAAQARRTAPVQRGDEYSSARERHAEANLAVIDLRHAARRAADTAHHCDEAVDVLRLVHRGLDGVRQDIHVMLRVLQFESVLER